MQWPCHGLKQSLRPLALSDLEMSLKFVRCGIYSVDGIRPFQFWDADSVAAVCDRRPGTVSLGGYRPPVFLTWAISNRPSLKQTLFFVAFLGLLFGLGLRISSGFLAFGLLAFFFRFRFF